MDYFQSQYPGTTIVFDMSLVYIVMAFFAVLANNILVETLSLNTRITFGNYEVITIFYCLQYLIKNVYTKIVIMFYLVRINTTWLSPILSHHSLVKQNQENERLFCGQSFYLLTWFFSHLLLYTVYIFSLYLFNSILVVSDYLNSDWFISHALQKFVTYS